MPQYKLSYFNLRGRAEVARILFALAGVEYEDNRIERVEWPKYKESTPFGQLPTLEVDGKVICQSHTIERYLARQFGFAGKTDWDQVRVDMIVECITDCISDLVHIRREQNEDKKKDLVTKYMEGAPKNFKHLEALLKENNGGDGYFVGDEITHADLAAYQYPSVISVFTEGHDLDWTNFPKISALRNKVASHPKIVEWIAKRPQTEF